MPSSVPNEAELAALSLIVANWNTRISLIKADPGINADTKFADLIIANYAGYLDRTPTWSPPNTDEVGRAFALSSTVTFPLPTGPSQTIYGWVLWEFGFTKLLEVQLFAVPINYSTVSSPIEFAVVYRLREDPFL